MTMTDMDPVTASYQILKRPAVIFDVDGTLADTTTIVHLVASTHPNWTGHDYVAFHEQARTIPARKGMPAVARCWSASGIIVIILTARSDLYRQYLVEWLDAQAIPANLIRMRAQNDYRPDVDVKRDHLIHLLRTYKIAHAYDDNPYVVAMLEEYGIPTTHVPGWTP